MKNQADYWSMLSDTEICRYVHDRIADPVTNEVAKRLRVAKLEAWIMAAVASASFLSRFI
jgi:hypothetical protein